jgi:glycosyltransferase involved in cell wall biosynthesis
MYKKTKISVVIPAYNEEGTLPKTLKEIKKLNIVDEIIVVDDGSKDKTVREITKINGIKIIVHPYNIGNGAAVKDGIRMASGRIIVTMDGDGQHKPKDIPRLVREIQKGYHMVVGARTSKAQAGLHRDLANKIYNAFARYITKFRIQDLTSGMRAVRADFAKSIIYLLPNSFSYPTTMTLALLRSGRSLKYIPINVAKRKSGKSKIKLLSDGIRFFLIMIKIATLFSPLRIFLPVSLLFFICGLGYSIFTLMDVHKLTNLGVLLITASVIIFMIGLISEQISQLRMDRSEQKD